MRADGYYGFPEASVRLEVTPRDAEVYVDGYYAGHGRRLRRRVSTAARRAGRTRNRNLSRGLPAVPAEGVPARRSTRSGSGRRCSRWRPASRRSRDRSRLNPPPGRAPHGHRRGCRRCRAAEPGAAYRRHRRARDPRGSQPPDPRGGRAAVARTGRVAIQVQPADAEMSIDGEAWRGPAGQDRLVIDLAEGSHTVEIRKPGYRTYVTQVEVRRGETTPLNVSLRNGPGSPAKAESCDRGSGRDRSYHEGRKALVSYSRLLTALLAAVIAPIASAAVVRAARLSQGQGQGAAAAHLGRRRSRLRPDPARAGQVGRARRTSTAGTTTAAAFYTSDRRENGGMGWWTDYPGADNNFSVRLGRADLRARQDEAGRPARQHRRSPHRSAALPLPDAAHGRRRHHPLQRRRGREPARLPAEGRLPLRRRFLGLGGVGAVVLRDRARAAAAQVSDRRHPAAITRSCARCTT